MLLNRILENAILPLGDLFLGTSFMRSLNRMRSYDNLSAGELRALQLRRLQETLDHAKNHSVFYGECSPTVSSNPVEWLKSFPVLTKEILRERSTDLLTMPIDGLRKKSSSGSSGVQSSVYVTPDELSFQRAMFAHWWEWSGYRIGDPMIQTGMSFPRGLTKATKDKLFRIRYVPAYSHKRDEIIQLLHLMQDKPGFCLGGYSSSLYLFAKIAEEEGISGIRLRSVITWGDKLFSHYRHIIERSFSTRVFETYGCTEGLMIAAQKDIDYLYIMTPEIYLEILDDEGREVSEGELGHVVVTSLTARAMPLIRYRLGDLAIKLPASAYPRDRELSYPLLQKVIGRDTDIVKTRSGKFMVVHSFTGIFEHIPEIRQFRIIQKDLDSITIEYIPGPGFHRTLLDIIKGKIHGGLGEPLSLTFEPVDEIPPTASGKPQIILSLLNNSRIST
jgi:phenylacetate-CoA ligase